jgi:hypothetical protein
VAADADPKTQLRKRTPSWLPQLITWMDDAIPIPFTRLRIGIDPILGLLAPGVGDGIAALTHVTLLWSAFRVGASRVLLLRMALNAAIDAAFGAVPILGDVFDVGWKANRRNLILLDRLEAREKPRPQASDYAFVGAVAIFVIGVLMLPVLIVGAIAAWLLTTLG